MGVSRRAAPRLHLHGQQKLDGSIIYGSIMMFSGGRLTLLHCIACVLLAGRVSVSARRPGACIKAGNEVDCVLDLDLCSARITIDPSTGEDCKAMVENKRSLNGTVCDRLVDAIESIALGHTGPSPSSSCIVVDIYPTKSGAPHVVPGLPVGDQKRIISTNLLLRGVGGGPNSGGGRSRRQSGGSTTPPPSPRSTSSPPATGQLPLVCGMDMFVR